MERDKGIFDGMSVGGEDGYEALIDTLFPAKQKFKMLQMLTRLNQRAHMPMTILGIFRRRYKSKFLEQLQEEHNLNKIALEGMGRGDLIEIVSNAKKERPEIE